MKLPYQVLHDLTDAERNFDRLQAAGLLLELAANGTTRKVAFGTGVCVQNGTAETNPADIAHGLKVVPQAVVATSIGGALAQPFACRWDSAASTASTFRMRIESSAAIVANVSFAWVAIG